MTKPRTFRSRDVCDLAGISYRQLDYWCRQGWLRPPFHNALGRIVEGGSGSARTWPEAEVAKACALSGMLRAGITLQVATGLIAQGRTADLAVRALPETLGDPTAPNLADQEGKVA